MVNETKEAFENQFFNPDINLQYLQGQQKPLMSNIIAGEVKSAIKSLKNGRATGPDCIEAELFKCIQSDGLEVVAKALHKALEAQEQLQDLNEGVIIAIQIQGKPKVPEIQRPLSLLNTIRKLFAK